MAWPGDLKCAALGNATIESSSTFMVKILRIIVKKQESPWLAAGFSALTRQYTEKTYGKQMALRVRGPLFRRERFGYP